MTSEDGGCEPCTVFVRLPDFTGVVDSEKIMESVERMLPGITRIPWTRASVKLKRDGRAPQAKVDMASSLVTYAARMKRGTWQDVSDVRTEIGATAHGTWFRVQSDPSTRAALAELGAHRAGHRAACSSAHQGVMVRHSLAAAAPGVGVPRAPFFTLPL